MTFTITRASDWYEESIVKTFDSLEELKEFQLESEHSLIIDFRSMSIVIYDDYIE